MDAALLYREARDESSWFFMQLSPGGNDDRSSNLTVSRYNIFVAGKLHDAHGSARMQLLRRYTDFGTQAELTPSV